MADKIKYQFAYDLKENELKAPQKSERDLSLVKERLSPLVENFYRPVVINGINPEESFHNSNVSWLMRGYVFEGKKLFSQEPYHYACLRQNFSGIPSARVDPNFPSLYHFNTSVYIDLKHEQGSFLMMNTELYADKESRHVSPDFERVLGSDFAPARFAATGIGFFAKQGAEVKTYVHKGSILKGSYGEAGYSVDNKGWKQFLFFWALGCLKDKKTAKEMIRPISKMEPCRYDSELIKQLKATDKQARENNIFSQPQKTKTNFLGGVLFNAMAAHMAKTRS